MCTLVRAPEIAATRAEASSLGSTMMRAADV
jgi:hypothetical protein